MTPIDPATSDALLESIAQQKAEGIFNLGDRHLLHQMVESMGDTRGMVRLRFAEMLGEIGAPATPLLLEALATHPNVVVRRAAAKTLTLIAPPEAVPNLVHSLLNDEDTVVKGSCIGALAQIGETAVDPLLEILKAPDMPESTKGHAAWALAFIGSEAKEYLYREITSESTAVRSAVVGALCKVVQENPNDEQALALLVTSLTDLAENVRSEAASALGNLAYRPAIPQLIELLAHPSGETRRAAALSLMKIGDRTPLDALSAAALQETEALVKMVLELAISQLSKQQEASDW